MQWCAETPSVGGGAFWPIDQLLLLKKLTENTVANSLAAWLHFDQLSCKFEILGARSSHVPPQSAHPWLLEHDVNVANGLYTSNTSIKTKPYTVWKTCIYSLICFVCMMSPNPENTPQRAVPTWKWMQHRNRRKELASQHHVSCIPDINVIRHLYPSKSSPKRVYITKK